MPDETWYQEIHERLLAGDHVASAKLAKGVLDNLIRALCAKFPNLRDEALAVDAAVDALMSYIKQPDQFDPTKRGLFGFLVMAAEKDLLNALAKIKRRKKREILVEAVEVDENDGNNKGRTEDPDIKIDAERLREAVQTLFDDPKDRQATELIMDNERSTEAFAEVYDLQELPLKEQRGTVKRHKDRITKRLQRYGESLTGHE